MLFFQTEILAELSQRKVLKGGGTKKKEKRKFEQLRTLILKALLAASPTSDLIKKKKENFRPNYALYPFYSGKVILPNLNLISIN